MRTQHTIPRSLRIVAMIFLAFGLCAVVEMLVKLLLGTYHLTTGVLGIPICLGLLRLSRGWRLVALISLWWGFILIPLIVVCCAMQTGPAWFDLFGVHVTEIPRELVALACVPFFLLNLWQYRVLVSPRVRDCFFPRTASTAP